MNLVTPHSLSDASSIVYSCFSRKHTKALYYQMYVCEYAFMYYASYTVRCQLYICATFLCNIIMRHEP